MSHKTSPPEEGSAVWAILQHGDPAPQPRQSATPEPPSERPPASPQQQGRARAIGIAVAAVVLVLAAVAGVMFGYVLPRQQSLSHAQSSFQTAVQAYSQAQIDLTSQISSAKNTAATVTAADVKDPATIDALNSALDSAQSLSAPAPAMGSTADVINNQVAEIAASTQATAAATHTLQSAVAAMQQSRVDKAADDLSSAIAAAQKTHDDSAWLGDTAERTALQTQIDQANTAVSAPDSLGSDTGAIVAALQTFLPPLQSANDAVAAAVQAAADATYTFVLTGDQLTCGVNVCYDGLSGGDPISAESAKITVQGPSVTAQLCFTSEVAVDPQTCTPTADDAPTLYGWSDSWTGTRDGDTAIVQSASTAFAWAVVTFAGTTPNSVATSLATGDDCERADGSYGQLDEYGRCA